MQILNLLNRSYHQYEHKLSDINCLLNQLRSYPVIKKATETETNTIKIIPQLMNMTQNYVAWDRERTIPTERPPIVGEVSANFLQIEGVVWSAQRIPRPYSRISRPEPLLFLPSSSSVVLMRLSVPRSRPITSQKIYSAGNRIRDLQICSQELWPLGHRGGPKHITQFNFNFKIILNWRVTINNTCVKCLLDFQSNCNRNFQKTTKNIIFLNHRNESAQVIQLCT
jgi:hypothetical protein